MKPHAVVDEVRVRDVMKTNVTTVHASHSMPLAASIMELERVRHVPVVDDERRVVGLVTHRDILAAQLRVVAEKPAAPLDGPVSLDLSVPVSTVMRTEVWTIQSTAPAARAASSWAW
jgi:CBS domain-containing membrane protein